uniref:Uncharacterized protein n=1 Tax=Pinctada fucata TaxID=50426 RepID=A0A194ALW5_PINFU
MCRRKQYMLWSVNLQSQIYSRKSESEKVCFNLILLVHVCQAIACLNLFVFLEKKCYHRYGTPNKPIHTLL